MKRILCLLLCFCLMASAAGCKQQTSQEGLGNGWEPEKTMQLQFAHELSVDYYTGGYKLITLGDGSRYLTIPEGMEIMQPIA